MSKEQIKQMVNRFLGWKLPPDFAPDAGVSFKPPINADWWPVGTNLLNAEQAESMVRHMLGLSDSGMESHGKDYVSLLDDVAPNVERNRTSDSEGPR